MAVRRKSTNLKVAPKFYIFIGAAAAAVVVIMLLIFNIQTTKIENGEIMFETQLPAVVVRSEDVVTAENYGKANFLVAEGDRVESGATVAEVYKWGYNDKVMNDLIEVQTKIEQYLENELLKNGTDEQLTTLNAQIMQKAAEVSNIITDKAEGSAIAAERELKALMSQKQQYLRDSAPQDQQLSDFYKQEEQLEERVDSWRQIVTAPNAGVVSYYFDGAETLLNADNLEKITAADLSDILNGSGKEAVKTTGTNAETPLFRLVNNYSWYLLLYSKTPVDELAIGNTFNIAFDEYIARQYQGTVVGSVTEDEKDFVYVVQLTDDIGELLDVRRATAKLSTKFTGFRVPEKALVEKDGAWGITVVENKQKTFVPVQVKIIKDGSAIVEPLDENTVLSAGMSIEV